ncbi:MAG: NAD-dependent epimerase/dehydratase family protein [Flavobacteriales bacterium]|jgi:nucleoside-diphosphate-sugar epimerase|nr:NAD-dependent epimerase/dehydratase family protein [Flavobacteriales bacterium]MBK6893221.1 NAD-dependent epimerase/dehydratase family protein [Flavobacteriales bacterium]MBK7249046.1 NAD-dependent epimerase/dehydratase family protein [Flavobacteriales bacterium]MBK7285619.1 NAD-dependent epimerase/dehydratase family protein [Flavobacteriales bacterium]MBK9599915.1 NAD-dependent epimerase/dehydratase family protein [Flavobacteriales bacterium]
MDLVTGGTGIVGAHVLDALLAQGRSVRALLRKGSDASIVQQILEHYHADGTERFQRIQWVEGDLFDVGVLREAMQGVDHVYHCAAMVSFDPRDVRELLRTNVEGTANVVDAALEAGVKRLCHVSSTATIGGGLDGGIGDETKAFVQDKNSSGYAISKAEAELEVYRGIAEGLDAVMVNPCVVFGPGQHGRSSMTMIDRVRKGSRFFPGGTNAIVDARDVATAMTRLIIEGGIGERYLLIGEEISYERLFTLIAQSAGKTAPSMKLPAWALELGWRAEALRTLFGGRPLITRNTARTASRIRHYNGSKAERLLGMRFRSAEEAVANVAGFIRR